MVASGRAWGTAGAGARPKVSIQERGHVVAKQRHTQVRSEERFTYSRRAVKFVWEGGEYIDIYFSGGKHTGTPFEVINVWDYETNTPRIERSRGAFVDECEEWLEVTTPAEINHYRAHHPAC